MTFTFNAMMVQPIVALLAGILILLVPRILNFIIAIYLIFVGVTGLWPHLLSGLAHWRDDGPGRHALPYAATAASKPLASSELGIAPIGARSGPAWAAPTMPSKPQRRSSRIRTSDDARAAWSAAPVRPLE